MSTVIPLLLLSKLAGSDPRSLTPFAYDRQHVPASKQLRLHSFTPPFVLLRCCPENTDSLKEVRGQGRQGGRRRPCRHQQAGQDPRAGVSGRGQHASGITAWNGLQLTSY